PEDHQARALHPARARALLAALPARGALGRVLRRHRRRGRARLGPARQLQGVVEGLEGTNESIISHRQNDVLRILTVFSVILLPLTLITGIFGMNVHFPGFDTS